MRVPENCPIQDILQDIKLVLELLNKIIEHCEKCEKEIKND